jgi:hypothetical protein
MFSAGVRAHYHASQLAAKSMVASQSGLIVNISFWAAQKHIANVAYGVSKAATDKMTADMAVELRPHGVTAVSLYPGLVTNSESPEFIGRAVAALAGDPDPGRCLNVRLPDAEIRESNGTRTCRGARSLAINVCEAILHCNASGHQHGSGVSHEYCSCVISGRQGSCKALRSITNTSQNDIQRLSIRTRIGTRSAASKF